MPYHYLLALETTGRSASLALVDFQGAAPRVRGQRSLPPVERTAKTLLPTADELLQDAGVRPAQIAIVAVAIGPGSFTGLRIGVTAAKTLAYATGAKLVGVNTLDVLAAKSEFPEGQRVWAVLDAQRGDVFAACYQAADRDQLGHKDRTELLAGEKWLAGLQAGDLVIGPAAARYADRLPEGVAVADATQCQPQAETVAQIGHEMIQQGLSSNPFQLVPQYHRLSAAEEKARERVCTSRKAQ